MPLNVRGESNRLLTMAVMSNYNLWRLKNQLVFPRLARRHHEPIFSDKVGDEIDILKPFKVMIYDGRTISSTDTYDPLLDETVKIKINNRKHGRLKFNDEERSLDIRNFGPRYLQPVAEELANRYDEDGAEELGLSLHYNAGTPGSSMDVDSAQDIRAYATEVSVQSNNRNYAILNPADFKAIAGDIKPLNVPDEVKRSTIYERFRGKLSDWYVFESVHVPYMECAATPGTPVINKPKVGTVGAVGYVPPGYEGSSLPVDGLTNSKVVFKKGQIINIAGVSELMVRGKKRRTGRKAQFVITEDVLSSGSGTATIKISPELNAGSLTTTDKDGNSVSKAAFKNVSAIAADNAAITSIGVAGKTYKQSLFYERDALEFVQVILVPPASATRFGVSTDPDSGASVMYLESFGFENVESKIRVDIKYGVKCVYPEVGFRHISEVVT